MRFFIVIITVILGALSFAFSVHAETSQPVQPPMTQSVNAAEGSAPKGEPIEWRWVCVSGVSENLITVVAPFHGRRASYEPVLITPETKITRAGKLATLKEIRVWQRVSLRGLHDGEMTRATEFIIGGVFPKVRSKKLEVRSRKVQRSVQRRIVPKQKAPVKKAQPRPKAKSTPKKR